MFNREGWLTELARMCEPLFKGYTLGKYRVTCGWPCVGGLSPKKRRIGECHSAKSSKDGTYELFISPVLDKPIDVAGTLVHEMAHIAAGIEAAHGKRFKVVANYVGLTKGRATEAGPGSLLTEKLGKLTAKLGAYPHSALIPAMKVKKAPSSLKLVCADCGCVCVMSNKWITEAGTPTCGCGGPMVLEDDDA